MHCVQSIAPDVLYVGGSDRRQALFENVFPIPRGVSYNAYLVLDEKTVLLDTVDSSIGERFFENLTWGLAGRELDYVVVNHMEPDHAATLGEVLRRYPGARVVGSAKTMAMIGQFFAADVTERSVTVKEGDSLSTGRHCFTFLMAPMVHWPEVMVTYDTAGGMLFSADAFGTFGALSGHLFADKLDFPGEWLADARRYYANIVGKYGVQVQSLLKKTAGLDIRMLCPLHGPIWRRDIPWFVEKYRAWSTYAPEEQGVLIACASVYGNTENAAEIVAARLAERGVEKIALYDLSHCPVSHLVGEAFRYSHLVLASATYNNGIFTPMESFLLDLKAHNFQNRTVALIENGTWGPQAGKLMGEAVGAMKNMTVLEDTVSIRSAVKEDQRAALLALADALAADILG
ncbi:FprA family A-type flavoprotein [uncultured Oscillibacter sp.]|uniref:FprA family A-type flavoprotein n=1 Tax=uncultured Oscillibacter sp. TaxID=876091 RepID=UPI0025E3D26E|nr:FprA family A-type flavoprotein [uncultured Oscillibacter sp.]